MAIISPDAFYLAHRQQRATFECLRSFRHYNPISTVVLMSDAGEDFSSLADRFGCQYRYCDKNVCPRDPMTADGLREWLSRFAWAARQGSSEFIILLEDDVLVRGPINRCTRFAMAGCWHKGALLSAELCNDLVQRWPQITAQNYGGCGGTLFHRQTLIDAVEAFDWQEYPRWAAMCPRVSTWADAFLTLVFLTTGHLYQSAHDVYCETWYPGWEHNGRPIVHQYKHFYGQSLTDADLGSV